MAQAAAEDEITRLVIDATVGTDGVVTVTQTMDVKFVGAKHGPYVWFVTQQPYDATHDRIVTYSAIQVTSPTGAPVDLDRLDYPTYLKLRIGDPNKTVRGTQTYVMTYTVEGLANPARAESGLDELNWLAVGGGWEIPIANVTVTVHGPAAVQKTACYTGFDRSEWCTGHNFDGFTSVFTQDALPAYRDLQVVTGWPIGTLVGAEPHLVELPKPDSITRYDVEAWVQPEGSVDVTESFDIVYGQSNPGPRFDYYVVIHTAGLEQWVTRSNFRASSPSGAPIGPGGESKGQVAGPQSYVVSYTMTGLPQLAKYTGAGVDTIHLTPVTLQSAAGVPVLNVTVHVPVSVESATCIHYPSRLCDTVVTGLTITVRSVNEAFDFPTDVILAWPAGTWDGADLTLTTGNPFDLRIAGPAPLAWTGGLAGVVGGFLLWLRGRGRDRRWVGVPLGSRPLAGAVRPTKRIKLGAVPVAFEPPRLGPDGTAEAGVGGQAGGTEAAGTRMPPRLAGALVRGSRSANDITATIFDLAQRGYLRVTSTAHGSTTFTQTVGAALPDDPIEDLIVRALFHDGTSVTSRQLRFIGTTSEYEAAVQALDEEFAAQQWYRRDPRAAAKRVRGLGIALAIVGTLSAAIVALTLAGSHRAYGWGWFALVPLAAGVGLALVAKRAPARTAEGTAAAVPALGFKRFLEAAESEQIRWELDHDIYSEYLPYAIAYGCADQWTAAFRAALERGATAVPEWFSGTGATNWDSVTAAISHATYSASSSVGYADSVFSRSGGTGGDSGGFTSDSGFSGGGDSGGGGSGGGGGGTW